MYVYICKKIIYMQIMLLFDAYLDRFCFLIYIEMYVYMHACMHICEIRVSVYIYIYIDEKQQIDMQSLLRLGFPFVHRNGTFKTQQNAVTGESEIKVSFENTVSFRNL